MEAFRRVETFHRNVSTIPVGGEQLCFVRPLQVAYDLSQSPLHLRVEFCRRFVENCQVGVVDQGQRYGQPLPFSIGEGCAGGAGFFFQAERVFYGGGFGGDAGRGVAGSLWGEWGNGGAYASIYGSGVAQ